MAGKLGSREKKQLTKWIGTGGKSFTLLYSITRDGCNVTTFHTKCDSKGPTVTVLYNTSKSVYGGYTHESWQQNGLYTSDSTAFLFRLHFNGQQAFDKYSCKTPTNAIYGHPSYGPIFGSGYDLYTFNGTIASQGTHFTLNGSTNLGTTYDMKGVPSSQVTNDSLAVTELEVYQVTDGAADFLLDEPWRRDFGWTAEVLEGLQNGIGSYSPPEVVGVSQARILLLGPVGAGKSSFFNSISSVFRGHVTGQACSGSAEQSITSKFRMYQMRESVGGRPLRFRLCDTRGLEENQGIDANELNFLLDGNVPDGYCFNPSMPISPDTPGFIKTPKLGQRIHCVCFVIDGSTVGVLSEKLLEKIKTMQAKIHQRGQHVGWRLFTELTEIITGGRRQRNRPAATDNPIPFGVPQVLLLTKIDKVCSQVEADVSVVCRSPAILDLVNEAADVFGMTRGHVLPMKNYDIEYDLSDDISMIALVSLRQMLRSADDFLINYIDEMEQQVGGILNTKD